MEIRNRRDGYSGSQFQEAKNSNFDAVDGRIISESRNSNYAAAWTLLVITCHNKAPVLGKCYVGCIFPNLCIFLSRSALVDPLAHSELPA